MFCGKNTPPDYFMANIMLFLGKAPKATHELLERLDLLGERLLDGLNVTSQLKTFTNEAQLLDCFDKEQIGIVRGGLVIVVNGGKDAICLEPGDIIGLSRVFGLPHAELKVEDEAEIELIQRDDFMSYVYSDAHRQHRFSNYLLTMLALYQGLLAYYHRHNQATPPTGFEHIESGSVMIKEGDYADTVYQLMSGSADVTVNGVTVGEVLSGEIFGAMAAFTGEKRNATVTAREDCQLLAIPKAQFVDLIKAQPEIAITLLDNMSRRIKSLNEQISGAQRQTA
ncbi:MAG: cyclic nucleotide-binding domain-containing protein [Bermanella sp.]